MATSDASRALQAALPGREPPEARRAREVALAEMDRTVREEWRLLLQAYSEEAAQMDWAASGLIHFGVPRDTLAARDFSRVWVRLQFL